MDMSNMLGLVELLLVLGVVLGFCFWELHKIARERRKDAAKAAEGSPPSRASR